MIHSFCLVALATIGISLSPLARAAAQAGAADTVLADTTIRDTGQRIAIHLRQQVIYRIHTDGAAQPTIKPANPRDYPPAVLRIQESGSSLGGPVYEFHVDRDGEYWLGAVTEGKPLRVQVRSDMASTRIVQERENRPSWGIGLHLGIGEHGSYQLVPGGREPSGLSYEAGVLISQGTVFRLILGAGGDKRGGGDFDVDWVMAELRGRMVHLPTLSEVRTLDIGALVRYAQGNSGQKVSSDPNLLAAGIYLQQHVTRSLKGRGVSLTASFYYGTLGNLRVRDQNRTAAVFAIQWLP